MTSSGVSVTSRRAAGVAYVLQTALVLLDLSLAAGAAFGDELGEVFALSLHTHPFIISSVVHPLRHVAAAGGVVRLQGATRENSQIHPHTAGSLSLFLQETTFLL